MKRSYLIGTIVAVLVIVFLSYYFYSEIQVTTLKIFHAGSLSLMLEEAEKNYESKFKVDIQREPSGSVLAVRKISDLGKRADIVMVADASLIEKYLMPNYTNWLIVFASNKVVLAYTSKSRYANEITSNNWYNILLKEDVKYGFSNPNLDPCGYRSLAILYMASKYYNVDEIWSGLVLNQLENIKVVVNESGHFIYFPGEVGLKGNRLVIRDKSVELVQLLEMGVIDYAFEYKNVAVEHGLKYIELPEEFSLAINPFINVTVILYADNPEKLKPVQIKRIKYGLTIPSNAENPEAAVKFLKWLLYGEGKNIIISHGFVLIPYEFIGNVPKDLRGEG